MGDDNRCRLKMAPSPRQMGECMVGVTQFSKAIEPYIKLRQQIAAEPDLASQAPTMHSITATLKELYTVNQQKCQNEYMWESCGFVMAHDKFVSFFGPFYRSATQRKLPPTVLNLYPLKSGYLMTDLEPRSSGKQVLFDTGASTGMYSSRWVDSHLDMFSVTGMHDAPGTTTYDISNLVFTLGNIHFSPSFGLETPIVDLLRGTDKHHQLIAIIGEDFLARRAFEVNFDTSKMTINPDVQSRSLQGKWDRIPIHIIENLGMSFVFGVNVLINGRQQKMVFDTGANSTTITAQCAQQYPELQHIDTTTINTYAGEEKGKIIPNVSIGFGTTSTTIPYLAIAPDSSSAIHGVQDSCGLLGLDIIKQHNFIYDPRSFTLYLGERKTVITVDSRKSGFFFNEKNGELAIGSVDSQSTAEKAGLKKGDVVLEINGRKMSDLTYIQLLDFPKLETHSMKISRDGKVITIDFSPDFAK